MALIKLSWSEVEREKEDVREQQEDKNNIKASLVSQCWWGDTRREELIPESLTGTYRDVPQGSL